MHNSVHVPIHVELSNVSCFSVERNAIGQRLRERALVKDVSFVAKPGQLIGLLGSSGSGKSTLLNLLANRGGALSSLKMRCTGRILFNGWSSEEYREDIGSAEAVQRPVGAGSVNGGSAMMSSSALLPASPTIKYSSNSLLQRRIGYLLQHDFLLPHLTVRETLLYAARLRLPSSMSDEDKVARVEELMTDLNLQAVKDSLIGDATHRGISGGERRRTSLAVQVLTNPSLLLADEPTTGLDSFTSLSIMQCLLSLSHGQGRTVLATLHQPRASIFELLDTVLLLSHGRVIFQGSPKECGLFFSRCGYHVPVHVNPADFFIDTISMTRTKKIEGEARDIVHEQNTEKQDLKRIRSLRHMFKKESSRKLLEARESDNSSQPSSPVRIRLAPEPSPASSSSNALSAGSSSSSLSSSSAASSASIFHQVYLLTTRGWLSILRDRGYLRANLLEVLFMAGTLGLVFWRMADDSQAGIKSRVGMAYLASSLHFYLNMIFFLFRFIPEICVTDCERENHMYGVTAVVASQQLIYLPFYIMFTTLYIVLVYVMGDLRFDGDISYPLIWIGGGILLQHAATSVSLMCCAISRIFAQSSLILNTIFSIFTVEAGYLVISSALPAYVKWLQPLSFTWYGFRLFVTTEFSHRQLSCVPSEQPTGSCDLFNGARILSDLDMKEDDYLIPCIGLVSLWFGFTCLSALILWALPQYAGEAAEYVLGVREIDLDQEEEEEDGEEVRPSAALMESNGDRPIATPSKAQSMSVMVRDEAAAVVAAAAVIHVAPIAPADKRPLVRVEVKHINLTVTKRRALDWKNFWKHEPGMKQKVLSDVSFTVEPGQLVALMGVSGCGKSSLLDLMARRGALTSSMEGEILFNGTRLLPHLWDSTVGYVQQADHLLPYLTVRETLLFAARLRLPASTTSAQRQERVEEVLRELGLEACADTWVGNQEVKGCSGGEQRRVSIAMQMLNDPAVLILDEPTSGLDAFNALAVTRTLLAIARRGRTVICSIHQPRSDVFELMDHLILMAPGGHLAFNGKREGVEDYFASAPLQMVFPPDTNTSDVLLDFCSLDGRTAEKEVESRQRVDQIVRVYADKQAQVLAVAEAHGFPSADVESLSHIHLSTVASIWVAFWVLLERSFLNLRRQQMLLVTVVCQTVAFGGILTTFYAPLGHDQVSIQSRLGIVQQLTGLIFIGNLNHLSLFVAQRTVFYREYSERAYTTAAFFFAYLAMEVILEVIGSGAVTMVFIYGAGMQKHVDSFMAMWFCLFCVLNGGESFAMSVGSVVSSIGVSLSITNCVFSFTSLIVGIYSLVTPSWLGKVAAWNVMKYLVRLVARGEFSQIEFYCTPSQTVIGPNGTEICPMTDGQQVLNMYDFNEGGYAEDMLVIGGLTIGYRIIAYIVLRYAVTHQHN